MSQSTLTMDEKDDELSQKKEKPSKEKKEPKVIPKYYAGTNVRKLPKIPKALLKDLTNMEDLIMTPQQRKAYLTAIVMGLIPDKFGLEVGIDQKLKAIAELNKMDNDSDGDELIERVVIMDDVPDTD